MSSSANDAKSVVLIDADNVRGSMGWPPTSAFRSAVCRWAKRELDSSETLAIVEADGRTERQHACIAEGADGVLCTFSGTRWKADDTVVRDCGWWLTEGAACVVVVSSDKQLRRRCREAAGTVEASLRAAGSSSRAQGRLRFESSEAFASALPAASPPATHAAAAAAADSPAMQLGAEGSVADSADAPAGQDARDVALGAASLLLQEGAAESSTVPSASAAAPRAEDGDAIGEATEEAACDGGDTVARSPAEAQPEYAAATPAVPLDDVDGGLKSLATRFVSWMCVCRRNRAIALFFALGAAPPQP
eukprot:4232203-Prymnesium_polylepis.2